MPVAIFQTVSIADDRVKGEIARSTTRMAFTPGRSEFESESISTQCQMKFQYLVSGVIKKIPSQWLLFTSNWSLVPMRCVSGELFKCSYMNLNFVLVQLVTQEGKFQQIRTKINTDNLLN